MVTFEHENQSALDGTTVWKRLVEEGKAVDIGTFGGKALLHNLTDNDYGRPLDEVRDLFWNTPRVPLLPEGDVDLQRAIYQAVSEDKLRLIGADGVTRTVARAAEIGVGQAGLRLAKPVEEEDLTGGVTSMPGNLGSTELTTTGGEGIRGTPRLGIAESNGGEPSPLSEQEISFTLMTNLRDPAKREALFDLLGQLMDRLDNGAITYGEFMVKLRVTMPANDELVEHIRATGTTPNVRDV